MDGFCRTGDGVRVVKKGSVADEHGSEAHKTVQYGDEFGHGGHLDPCGENCPDDGANNDHGDDDVVVAYRGIE